MDTSSTTLHLELWEGTVPTIVSLCPDDVTALTVPDPIYVMIPRMGYLANIVNTVVECFQDSVPRVGLNNEVWFEWDKQPLNWQLPAGVLYDICSNEGTNSGGNIPWRLTVHFQSFPSALLVSCSSDKAFEQHYFHSIKQGLFIEHGNSAAAMSLELKEQQQLWESLCRLDPSSFYLVDNRLHRRTSGCDPVAVPVRLVVPGADPASTPIIIQPFCKLEKPRVGTSGSEASEAALVGTMTVGDLLTQNAVVVTTGSGHAGERQVAAEPRVMAHGTLLPLSAPLVEVWSALAHPDNFLYITVLPS
mmetsp:Transcript_23022/g.47092  ORF Transcript_23022/g.47092 Transcript_23022/m.47092 type:complete len:304 (-) Transcript_23022:311-1222(-)